MRYCHTKEMLSFSDKTHIVIHINIHISIHMVIHINILRDSVTHKK